MKNLTTLFFASLLSGTVTLGSYKLFFENNEELTRNEITTTAPLRTVSGGFEMPDLTNAAKNTIHTVVHVKNVSFRAAPRNPIYEYFYGYQNNNKIQAQVGMGSGVIISEDGYIVTNNHVIQGANKLEITLNDNRTFPAKLVGTDSKMDIALLKIDANEKLPYSTFADSDAINVGEWVLAVGNPYNLNSTVTAGIVSAKARNLSSNGIQSFIQTDAAVNPGNSGGALVNTRGELIGINTMISSETGSYVGYSFAVPSNITRKIIEDLMEFGNVQQGVLGVNGFELNKQIAENKKTLLSQGFYVEHVIKNSGAEKAQIKKGDIITKIDNKAINNFLELNAIVATKRPKDQIKVTLMRDDKEINTIVSLSKKEIETVTFNGFELENLTESEKNLLGINYGIKIKEINNSKYQSYIKELKGSVILAINGTKINDTETANEIIAKINENEQTSFDILTKNGERVRLII